MLLGYCDFQHFSLKYNPPKSNEDLTTVKIYDKRQYNLEGYKEPGYFYVEFDLFGNILEQIHEFKKFANQIYLFQGDKILYYDHDGLGAFFSRI